MVLIYVCMSLLFSFPYVYIDSIKLSVIKHSLISIYIFEIHISDKYQYKVWCLYAFLNMYIRYIYEWIGYTSLY